MADLKKELKERGLTLSGTKAELVERLLASMNTGLFVCLYLEVMTKISHSFQKEIKAWLSQ